ncbi:MAG: hypothetical protein ACRD4E_02765 [Bryobacteraceae bacterium]
MLSTSISPLLSKLPADFVLDFAPGEVAVERRSLGVELALHDVKRLVAFENCGLVKLDIDLLRERGPHSERQQRQH